MFLANSHIEKVNLLVRVIRGEFDGAVERIDVIDEGEQAILITGPNEEDVINVAPPDKGTAGSRTEHAFFKARHKQACIGRSHPGSHGSPVSLKVMLVHEREVVFGENLLHESFDVRDGWTRVDLLRQGCTRGCDTFSMRDVSVQRSDVESTDDGCTGDLVFDIFKFPEEIWSVMDIRINLRNKRFDEVVHKQGYLLGGGPIARDDRPTRVTRLVNFGQEIKPGCLTVCGRKERNSLLRDLVPLVHISDGLFYLLGENICGIRIKKSVNITVGEMTHGFLDVILSILDDNCRTFVGWLDDNVTARHQ